MDELINQSLIVRIVYEWMNEWMYLLTNTVMKGRMNDNGLMDFLDFNQRILNALLTFCV